MIKHSLSFSLSVNSFHIRKQHHWWCHLYAVKQNRHHRHRQWAPFFQIPSLYFLLNVSPAVFDCLRLLCEMEKQEKWWANELYWCHFCHSCVQGAISVWERDSVWIIQVLQPLFYDHSIERSLKARPFIELPNRDSQLHLLFLWRCHRFILTRTYSNSDVHIQGCHNPNFPVISLFFQLFSSFWASKI